MPVMKLVAQRSAFGFATLLVVTMIIFLGVELLPGDVATEILGQSATPETVAALRQRLGLDEPLVQRYAQWLFAALGGDFGQSLANGRPISDLVQTRFSNTLFLAGCAAIVAVPVSIGLGLLAALRPGGLLDRVANVVSLISISVPEFFLAYILIAIFATQLGWLPSLSRVDDGMAIDERLYRILLPALTLILIVAAHMIRMTRTSILSIMSSPFIEMARLKGASRARIVLYHALPNAFGPILNIVVLNLAYLVVGVVVVEVVFVYPGLGQLMVDSVQRRDLPVVQACGLLFAATYILLNLSADILSTLANPRMRFAQ